MSNVADVLNVTPLICLYDNHEQNTEAPLGTVENIEMLRGDALGGCLGYNRSRCSTPLVSAQRSEA
jgi:hypothetical protein